MTRTLIKDLAAKVGEKVLLQGRIFNIRKLGNISFIILNDYTGSVQIVWKEELDVRSGDTASIEGEVKADKRSKTGVEVGGTKILDSVKSVADLPIDLSKNDLNAQLNTLLDHRPLTLRHPSVQAIFKLYDLFLKGYESAMREEGFTEVKTPKLLETASEGGGNFFKIDYFEKKAFLAQSPQFYKQILVGVFERVFEIGSTFRAEPHFTTRHVNEYISLDAEMGFIKDFDDVMSMLNKVLHNIFAMMKKEGQEYLAYYKAEINEVPERIPRVKLADIKKIIKERYGYAIADDTDIDPEGERLAGRYAKEEFNSDFIFLTNYPWKYRAFYTMPSKENPEETYGFDLLFKGMEIVSGGQRIHIYDELIKNMEKKGIKPKGMEFYLDTFKFAIPPHGGWGLGSERVIQLILGLQSIKEAVLFPRDVNRLSP